MCWRAGRQHTDYAQVAAGLVATQKPGMGKHEPETLSGDKLVEHLAKTLATWHSLAFAKGYDHTFARDFWQKEIVEKKLLDEQIAEPPEDATGQQRKKYREELLKKLKPAALKLSQWSPPQRDDLAKLWHDEWKKHDGDPASGFDHKTNESGQRTGKTEAKQPATLSPSSHPGHLVNVDVARHV